MYKIENKISFVCTYNIKKTNQLNLGEWQEGIPNQSTWVQVSLHNIKMALWKPYQNKGSAYYETKKGKYQPILN